MHVEGGCVGSFCGDLICLLCLPSTTLPVPHSLPLPPPCTYRLQQEEDVTIQGRQLEWPKVGSCALAQVGKIWVGSDVPDSQRVIRWGLCRLGPGGEGRAFALLRPPYTGLRWVSESRGRAGALVAPGLGGRALESRQGASVAAACLGQLGVPSPRCPTSSQAAGSMLVSQPRV